MTRIRVVAALAFVSLCMSTAPSARASRVRIPRGYAVIIGISNYQNLDAQRQLRFPETDAEAIYRVLISQQGGAFPAENVHLLLGHEASLADIRRELEEWLPSVATETDRVIVFFAGHGFVDGGRGYLAPSDVDATRLDSTAYSMTQLGDVLANKVKASWKVLLTDACHSGKINAETTNETLARQFGALPTNFLTFTATTEREQSYEDPELSSGYGLFTYFLTQAWKGHADEHPCDGVVTADELIEYVRSNVRQHAKDRKVTQTPTARGEYDSGMVLGVTAACQSDRSRNQPRVGTAIVEANLDDVSVFVDGAFIARVNRSTPLTIPALAIGLHEFKGVHDGYEPETKQIMVAPGQTVTVTFRIRYVRRRDREAR